MLAATKYAAYRAAWRTLGRPEIDREELELSDGQLRVRVRAHEREAAWAPRYVGNELAGTHQVAATYRQTAALRIAEADSAAEPAEQERLRAEATQAHALADTLDARAAELQQLDDARAHWLAHTAGTRAAAERAKAELAVRHVDDTEPEQQVTAEEWLAAHRAALAQDEPHRDITETDVRDCDVADRADEDTLDEAGHAQPVVPDRDLREIAAEEPVQVEEDVVRVPSAAETSDAIQRANRALVEIRARDAADAQEAAEYRAEELIRWRSDDQAAGPADADEDVAGDEPAEQPVAS